MLCRVAALSAASRGPALGAAASRTPLVQYYTARALATNVPKSKRRELAVAHGTLPTAELKAYKPTCPSLRHRIIIDKSHLWPDSPVACLTSRINSHAGHNNSGKITIRGRTAPKHRRLYRQIDFHRGRTDPAVVQRFEYDPNRSTFIALVKYELDGALSYILAPADLAVGETVQAGEEAAFAPGNAMALGRIPDGAEVHNVELYRGRGGKLVRSAGNAALLLGKDAEYATLKLPSGETRKVPAGCYGTIGALSNDQWRNVSLGKAVRASRPSPSTAHRPRLPPFARSPPAVA
jgi:large subunit ribosomal protein L2